MSAGLDTHSRALVPARPLHRLLAAETSDVEARGRPMPQALSDRYGGELIVPLRSDRPTIVANFVSTLDGVVALDTNGASGGGEISGFHEPDRFVMGMLRALSDVVVVGAGTVRAAREHTWTPGHVHPASAGAFRAWRDAMGLADADPMTIVLTNRGDVPRDHPGLRDVAVPVTILTTESGARRVRRLGFGPNVVIRTPASADDVQPSDVIAAAAEVGGRLVLCEGGPHILGRFATARVIDELFLTLAPQLAGRAPDVPRLGLIEGTAFDVDDAPWAGLRSVHASGDHLFLRYAFRPPTRDGRQEEHP